MSEEDSNLSQDSDEYRRWKAGGKTDVVHLCPRGCKGSLIEEDGLLMCNECDGVKFSVGMLAEGTRSPLEQMTGDHRQDLIKEKYRGIRPAFGYPACPNHEEKTKLFDILKANEIGMKLTGNYSMMPAASVSGLYFANNNSRYFSVGKINNS